MNRRLNNFLIFIVAVFVSASSTGKFESTKSVGPHSQVS